MEYKAMTTEVTITSAPQQIPKLSNPTTATVQVQFDVLGILPDVVQIYASQVTSEIGQLADTVDMNSPEFQYTDQIQLQAGSMFNLAFCPRTKTGDILDDTINDNYWEASCVYVQVTTQSTTPTPPPNPPPNNVPPGYSGGVDNVRAKAIPFGKIVLSWQKNGSWVSLLKVWRYQKIGDTTFSGAFTVLSVPNYAGNDDFSKGGFTDTGPFILDEVYNYVVTTTAGQGTAYAATGYITYPAYFGLRQFLPLNFDPSGGIKRLRPLDLPFVSVRKIMTG
jgi:hypothetical protein